MGVLEDLLQAPIDPANARAIVGAFAFVNGFLTYVLTTVISRKVYIRLQRVALLAVLLLMFSLLLGIADLLAPGAFGASNSFLKVAAIIWTAGIVALGIVLYRVLAVSRTKFRKPRNRAFEAIRRRLTRRRQLPFEIFQRVSESGGRSSVNRFGLSCIDDSLVEATQDGHRLYFPILLTAAKDFRPWRVANRFAAAGLKTGEGVIYFAFNQPAEIVVDQIRKRLLLPKTEQRVPGEPSMTSQDRLNKGGNGHLIVIDCHSSWTGRRARRRYRKRLSQGLPGRCRILYADPRNPMNVAASYKKAIAILLKQESSYARAIYDTISDFLVYSDPELAVQFMKHNMVWEDQNRVSSLYVYVPGVPKSTSASLVDEDFLRWNAYCVFGLAREDAKEFMTAEGLFDESRREEIRVTSDGDYLLVRGSSEQTSSDGLGPESEPHP